MGDVEDAQNVRLLQSKGIRAVLTVARGLGLYYRKSEVAEHRVIAVEDLETQKIGSHFE